MRQAMSFKAFLSLKLQDTVFGKVALMTAMFVALTPQIRLRCPQINV